MRNKAELCKEESLACERGLGNSRSCPRKFLVLILDLPGCWLRPKEDTPLFLNTDGTVVCLTSGK